MSDITSAVNVNVDLRDKNDANTILKSLGLNMSTFVNMAIKQLIKKGTIPFEITNTNPVPNQETIEALKEADDIITRKTNAKGYRNMDELRKDLLSDD